MEDDRARPLDWGRLSGNVADYTGEFDGFVLGDVFDQEKADDLDGASYLLRDR